MRILVPSSPRIVIVWPANPSDSSSESHTPGTIANPGEGGRSAPRSPTPPCWGSSTSTPPRRIQGMQNRACNSRSGLPKKQWATPRAAEFVAEWQTVICKNPTHAYHCEECGKWHVATTRSKHHR